MSDNSQENPENQPNPTPEEQLEMRVLAMLLGETDEAETLEVQELIEQDPQLQAYAEKMRKTMGFVDESAKSLWSEETTAPQQLSEDRRKVLEELWADEKATSGNVEDFPATPEVADAPKKSRKVQIHPFIPVAAAASLAILIGGVWFPKILKQQEDSQVAMSAELPETVVMDESNSMPNETNDYDEEDERAPTDLYKFKVGDFNYEESGERKERLRHGDVDGDGLKNLFEDSSTVTKQKQFEKPDDAIAPDVSLELLGADLKKAPPAKTAPKIINGELLERTEEIANAGGFDGRNANRESIGNIAGTSNLSLAPTTLKDLEEGREMKAKRPGAIEFADKFNEELKSESESKPATVAIPESIAPRKLPSPQPTSAPAPAPEPEPAPEVDPIVVTEKAQNTARVLAEKNLRMSKATEPTPDSAPAPVESSPVPAPIKPISGNKPGQEVVTTNSTRPVSPARPTAPPSNAPVVAQPPVFTPTLPTTIAPLSIPQPSIRTAPATAPVGNTSSTTQQSAARSNTRTSTGNVAPESKMAPRRTSITPPGLPPPPAVTPPKLPNFLEPGLAQPAEPTTPSAASAPRPKPKPNASGLADRKALQDMSKVARGPSPIAEDVPADAGQPGAPASNESRLDKVTNAKQDGARRQLTKPGTNFRYRNNLGDGAGEAAKGASAPFGGGMKADEVKKRSTGGIALTDNLSISGFIDGSYSNLDHDATTSESIGVDSVELDFTFTGETVSAEVHLDDPTSSKDSSEKKSVDKLSSLSRGLNDELMDIQTQEGQKAPANKEIFSRDFTLKGAEQSGPTTTLHYGVSQGLSPESVLHKSESTIVFDQAQLAESPPTGLGLGKSLEREKLISGRDELSATTKIREEADEGEVSALTSKLKKTKEALEAPVVVKEAEEENNEKLKKFANDITDDLGIEVEVVLPEPKPEVLTAQSPFSTFSLNVTDASFRLCEASLLNGQLPPPHIVRAEEFINAFDYRDPAPTGRKALSFAWDRSRHPFAHNRDLVRFSIQTAAEGRQGGQPLNLVLTIDNSGSMERADRVAILQQALKVLSTQLKPQDKASVIAFARSPRLWINGMNGQAAAKKLAEYDAIVPQGGTNIESALNLAYETAQKHFIQNGNNRVILLTDGAANLGEVVPKSLRSTVETHRKKAIALDCFGIGWDGYNDHLMEALARNGDGRYAFLNSPKDVERDFARKLAGALTLAAADVKVQVEFNPKRVKTHRQIGYLRHQLKKEDFRNNSIDAAEIGSAESGNAMYVLQIDPKGSGNIGTVKVRFREPATGKYKETSWKLPYKSKVPALDQADPAMRLAATAASFAEWLGRSPYAGDVQLSKLQQYITGLQKEFPAHSPVQTLLQMIRAAELSK